MKSTEKKLFLNPVKVTINKKRKSKKKKKKKIKKKKKKKRLNILKDLI